MAKKKIAYFLTGRIPFFVVIIADILQELFPEYEVEVINILKMVRARKDIVFINAFSMVSNFGLRVLTGKMDLAYAFFATPYIHDQMKKLARKRVSSTEEYAFSFQSLSFYDASRPDLMHFIFTDHSALTNLTYPSFDKRDIPSAKWIAREKQTYQNAAMTFTISTILQRTLIEEYDCDPDKVACIGVGTSFKTEASPQRKAASGKNILFVGIDWERKGGPHLVEAFRKVLQVHPDAHLTIVGCKPDVDVPNCTSVGLIPVEEVKPAYEAASIFCLPTLREPFGVVFIEAFYYKLPIVATRIGAIPDIVDEGESGYLVEPGNIDQLADRLIDLLDDPDRSRRFGEQGYLKMEEKYTWEVFRNKLNQLIRAKLETTTDA